MRPITRLGYALHCTVLWWSLIALVHSASAGIWELGIYYYRPVGYRGLKLGVEPQLGIFWLSAEPATADSVVWAIQFLWNIFTEKTGACLISYYHIYRTRCRKLIMCSSTVCITWPWLLFAASFVLYSPHLAPCGEAAGPDSMRQNRGKLLVLSFSNSCV